MALPSAARPPWDSTQTVPTATRQTLVDAALLLFAAHGYTATSLRSIADAGGVTKAVLAHHFGAKEDLVVAILEPILRGVEEVLALPPSADLATDHGVVLHRYVDVLLEHRQEARLLCTDPAVQRSAAGLAWAERHRTLVRRLVGPRGSVERQIRANCALAVSRVAVTELVAAPAHQLRQPLQRLAVEVCGAP